MKSCFFLLFLAAPAYPLSSGQVAFCIPKESQAKIFANGLKEGELNNLYEALKPIIRVKHLSVVQSCDEYPRLQLAIFVRPDSKQVRIDFYRAEGAAPEGHTEEVALPATLDKKREFALDLTLPAAMKPLEDVPVHPRQGIPERVRTMEQFVQWEVPTGEGLRLSSPTGKTATAARPWRPDDDGLEIEVRMTGGEKAILGEAAGCDSGNRLVVEMFGCYDGKAVLPQWTKCEPGWTGAPKERFFVHRDVGPNKTCDNRPSQTKGVRPR